MEHSKLLGASAFAALSLIFVFSTGGFSDQPSLRTQVASLEQEVSDLRASLPAAVNTSTKIQQVSSGEACAAQYYTCQQGCGSGQACLDQCRTAYLACKSGNGGGAVVADPGLFTPIGRLTKNNVLADVQKIQTALINKGYLKGVADGKFGSGTEAAVKTFQRASGLPETGIVDPATSVALFATTQTPVSVTSPIVTPPVTMSLVSVTSNANVGEGVNNDVGVFRVKFKVTAGSNDIYIPSVAAQALSYTLQRAGSAANLAQGSAVIFGAENGATLTAGSRFKVPARTTATFELVNVAMLPGVGQSGLYRLVVNGVNWATSDTATPTAYPLSTPYATSYISLN